jgi:hypothetical protein
VPGAVAVVSFAKHRVIVKLHGLVAFTSRVPQPLDIDNGDMAATVFDEVGLLERARDERACFLRPALRDRRSLSAFACNPLIAAVQRRTVSR